MPPAGEQEQMQQHGLQHGQQHEEQRVQLLPGHVASLDPQEQNAVMLSAVDLEHHQHTHHPAMSGIESSEFVVISMSPSLPRAAHTSQTLHGRAHAEHQGVRGQVSPLFPSGSPGLAPSGPEVAGAPPPPGTRADVRHPPLIQAALHPPTLIQDRNVVMSICIDPSSSSAPEGVLQAEGLQDDHTVVQARWHLFFIVISITKLLSYHY